MANQAIYVYGTQQILEASGGSAASNAFAAANDKSLGSADHLNYPDADFALTCSFAANVTPGTYVNLYRQDLAIDGATNALLPATTYRSLLVGTFMMPSAQSAAATYPCPNVPLSANCQFSIENITAQTIPAGWILKATPKTLGPSA